MEIQPEQTTPKVEIHQKVHPVDVIKPNCAHSSNSHLFGP